MSSKSAIPSYDPEPNDLPPPSYNDSLSTTSIPPNSLNPFTTQITTQLEQLTSAITSTRQQATLLASIHDQCILSYLTPHIHTYLSDFSHTGLTRGSLILVPYNELKEVSEKALPTAYDFKDPEEFDRIVRVRGEKETDGEKERWFWRDEEMAIRIAGELKPRPDPRMMELPPRKEELLPKKESKSFWGRRKSIKPVIESPDERGEKGESSRTENKDKVIMDVKAEEIVFRTENEFGILGTEKGWGIVVTMKVHLARN